MAVVAPPAQMNNITNEVKSVEKTVGMETVSRYHRRYQISNGCVDCAFIGLLEFSLKFLHLLGLPPVITHSRTHIHAHTTMCGSLSAWTHLSSFFHWRLLLGVAQLSSFNAFNMTWETKEETTLSFQLQIVTVIAGFFFF